MCGIAYVKTLDGRPASRIALKRYHKQSARGKEGFGYVPIEDGYVRRVERFTDEQDFIKSLQSEKCSEILLHHRAPTSTDNYIGTTHPVVVDDPIFAHVYYLVHNGVLLNEDELKKKHEKDGLVYNTQFERVETVKFKSHTEDVSSYTTGFLDSEALAKEVALKVEGFQNTIDTRGGVAFVCIETERNGKVVAIHYGRNEGRPLIVENVVPRKKKKKHGSYVCLKSEGGGEEITANSFYTVDYATGECTEEVLDIGEQYSYKSQYGFSRSYQAPETPKQVPLLPPRKSEGVDEYLYVDTGRSEYDTITEEDIDGVSTAELGQRLEEIYGQLSQSKIDSMNLMDAINTATGEGEFAEAQFEYDALAEDIRSLNREKDMIIEEINAREAGYQRSPYAKGLIPKVG